MSENSGFFNAQLVEGEPDRTYEASHFAAYYASLIASGVFTDPATNLQVVAGTNAQEVILKAGKAFIQGYWYDNSENLSLFFSPNSGTSQERWDEVVLELNLSTREITAKVVTGQLSRVRPTPTVTRSGSVYQLCLAQLKIPPAASTVLTDSYIYDTRSMTAVCGWVKGLIDQIDATDLFNQYNTAFNEWFADIQYKLSENTAGKLQSQIDDIREQNACYVTVDFPAHSTETAVIVESSSSFPTSGGIVTLKNFSFAGAETIQSQGAGITVSNSQSGTTVTFTEIGTYRVKLQLDGRLSTEISVINLLTSALGLYLRDLTNNTDFVTFLSGSGDASLHNGIYSYESSSGFAAGVWYSKEVLLEVTAEMLNKPLKLLLTTRIIAGGTASIAIEEAPGIYLIVERIKKESPIPQNLIGNVGMTQSAYDELEDPAEDTLYIVTPDPVETEG